mmetsp:Transcript_43997/g.86845  ORF Transcript_43997/g.86845 Transcript_43997/m.86845 type:complete len:145 (-) Transcript_43997:984-1418(-)
MYTCMTDACRTNFTSKARWVLASTDECDFLIITPPFHVGDMVLALGVRLPYLSHTNNMKGRKGWYTAKSSNSSSHSSFKLEHSAMRRQKCKCLSPSLNFPSTSKQDSVLLPFLSDFAADKQRVQRHTPRLIFIQTNSGKTTRTY